MKKSCLTLLLALCLVLGLALPAAAASTASYDVKNNVTLSVPTHFVVFTPENPVQSLDGQVIDASAQLKADDLKLLARDKISDALITVTTEKSSAQNVNLTKDLVSAMKNDLKREYEQSGYTMLDYTSYQSGQIVFLKTTFRSGDVYSRLYYTLYDGSEVGVVLETGAKSTLDSLSTELEQIAASVKIGAAANPFKDVKSGAYYYDPVLWAVKHNPQITAGTSATTFSPNDTCTRGQVVTFLWRAAGQPAPKSAKNPFKDVAKSAYYYDAVLWAVEQGITAGTSKTTFGPTEPCTRAHVVTFLWRAEGTPNAKSSNPFKDVKSGQYYYDAALWAVKSGVTVGTSKTTFSPRDPCTRGQIVTFLYRDMT